MVYGWVIKAPSMSGGGCRDWIETFSELQTVAMLSAVEEDLDRFEEFVARQPKLSFSLSPRGCS